MKVLIIANSRFKGGLSGGDAIYESFKKFWPCEFISSEYAVEYRPFFLCYVQRIFMSIMYALADRRDCDIVYSSSDFLPDSIAGFYLKAFKENPIHYYTQKMVRKLIEWFADMVIVTNPTMYDIFPDKKKTWINGGIDLSLAGLSDEPKIYDAVFCGRIHPSKGIDELIEIWSMVRKDRPNARLALIGDGDLGLDYVRNRIKFYFGLGKPHGIDLLGYMGDDRFKIYKQSKLVLYPTPLKYDHFSMAPIEAMACGCPIVCFHNPVNYAILGTTTMLISNIEEFKNRIIYLLKDISIHSLASRFWSEKYDYRIQSLRVWEDLNENLDYGKSWYGRNFSVPSFKRSRPNNTKQS